MEDKILQIRNEELFEKSIAEMLEKWLIYVGIRDTDAFMEKFKDIFLERSSIFEAEKRLHGLIEGANVSGSIKECLEVEEDLVFNEVKPYLIDGNALDIGTGSGMIAQKINDAGFSTSIVDVIDFNKSILKSTIYDGRNIPFPDNAFKNVTLLTVLHHCDYYNEVLSEAIRVCQGKLIIIESVFTNQQEYYANMFFDWLWNRVVYQDVNVPFNFHKPEEWEQIFKGKGLMIDRSIDLGYDSPMTPEHHWLFVLNKIE